LTATGSGESRADGITFLLTGEGAPEPLLAFETAARVLEIPEGSPDPIDAIVGLYLAKGFTLVTKPLLPAAFPRLEQWAIGVGGHSVTVTDDDGTIAFSAPRGDVTDEWLKIVRTHGLCRVITGTGLGVNQEDFWPVLEEAVNAGRVVGATIPTR
jgi:hypothetical protein